MTYFLRLTYALYMGSLFVTETFIVVILGIYFAPTVWAFGAKRKNKIPILLLNLFLGWTLIGWVVALVWAAVEDK